ncbi:Mss4-like protein [Xylariales sp. PMI_506]|nr:Mss4-like protein [Xylariales sp. PMI_506]
MSNSTTERTGSCLCGAIQLKIKGDPVITNLCHCTSCQKFTGVVLASIVVYNTEQLTYTSNPPDALRTYADGSSLSGARIDRSFCGVCGSGVRNIGSRFGGRLIAVPAGIIDGDKADLRPRHEFFCVNREGWIGDIEGAEKFALMPPA